LGGERKYVEEEKVRGERRRGKEGEKHFKEGIKGG